MAKKQSETGFRNNLTLDLAKKGIRLFRNNVGLFFTRNGTPTRCGLAKGSSDLIGWKTIKIKPDMVGQSIAVFVCIETKTNSGYKRKEQRSWNEAVNKAGGVALFLRPKDTTIIEDIEEYINDRFSGIKSSLDRASRKLT